MKRAKKRTQIYKDHLVYLVEVSGYAKRKYMDVEKVWVYVVWKMATRIGDMLSLNKNIYSDILYAARYIYPYRKQLRMANRIIVAVSLLHILCFELYNIYISVKTLVGLSGRPFYLISAYIRSIDRMVNINEWRSIIECDRDQNQTR